MCCAPCRHGIFSSAIVSWEEGPACAGSAAAGYFDDYRFISLGLVLGVEFDARDCQLLELDLEFFLDQAYFIDIGFIVLIFHLLIVDGCDYSVDMGAVGAFVLSPIGGGGERGARDPWGSGWVWKLIGALFDGERDRQPEGACVEVFLVALEHAVRWLVQQGCRGAKESPRAVCGGGACA